ncbi:MAG: acyl-CoA thioesterase [Phototrophicaceae bacterium]
MSDVSQFVAETTLRIRYAETDAMRIVHHSNFIVFFEEGRSAYARQRGRPYSDFEKAGYYLIVAEVHARYHKPAHYEQEITVRTWLQTVQSRGMTFAYEIVDANSRELLVSGHTRHICISQDGQVARMPDMWLEWAKS